MSKRIVLVDTLGRELFSGASLLAEPPPEDELEALCAEDARQGAPQDSGIFFRGAPVGSRKDPRAA